ncbi:MAG: MoxR family ATPase [Chloroflexi bacterium]|nr:MoxR family ATPase [Chloroflexota bacterium]
MTDSKAVAEAIIDNVAKVIVGKRHELALAVAALLAQGHILIEDVPGVGKTTLAKSIAKSLGCTFNRLQFTPDLLPSDVTGTTIFSQKTGEFEFRPGPIMAQIVLVDEINRASPKSQSALLECMEERQITVDGATHKMPLPFWVMATQNPIEYEGTFPLPEAQLDRFLMRLSLGYPSTNDEILVMERQQRVHPFEELEQVVVVADLLRVHQAVKEIYVDSLVKEYIVALVDGTRRHSAVQLGASPRGSLALFRTGQAWALLQGRDYVLPDDIKAVTQPILAHRLIINPALRMKGASGSTVVDEILASTPVPGVKARPRS